MSKTLEFMRDVDVEGMACLDAGTGAGRMARYLVRKGARLVYSISNSQEHLHYARSQCSERELQKIVFINADLASLDFLPAETFDLITAHMLINVVPPVKLFSILKELTRVAKRGAVLVLIDYNPLSSYQTSRSHLVEDLFRLENAIRYLIEGEPALVWYPSDYVVDVLERLGWVGEDVRLIYSKTPWEKELLKEHLDEIEEMCRRFRQRDIGERLLQRAVGIVNQIGDDEIIYAGTVYGIRMQKK